MKAPKESIPPLLFSARQILRRCYCAQIARLLIEAKDTGIPLLNTNLTVLTADGEPRARWIELLDALPPERRDIHFHPDYLRIYEETYGNKPLCLVLETENGTIWQPILQRDIPESDLCDITSVYGYGGAIFAHKPSRQEFDHFQNAVTNWAKETGCVSEYCLIHPFFSDFQRDALPSDGALNLRKNVVNANLSKSVTELWSSIEDRQRKAVLSARKRGVKVLVGDNSDEEFDDFHQRYIETMNHVGASEFWHFPDNYFKNCRDSLGIENVTFFHAWHGDKIVASVFHIHLYDAVYYHFSCSDIAARALNPMPLLLFDSMLWAKSAGFKNFHMGGGRTNGQDTLYKFKNSFCGSTLPLYEYSRVFDDAAFQHLTNEARAHEIRLLGAPKETEFFPRYRA